MHKIKEKNGLSKTDKVFDTDYIIFECLVI